ncbi:beta-glycosyltransferase/ family 2 [Synechococcus sp. PROS-7-1]|uniref:TIGR04283 family arsenosugar biosynthesis glycosyltransferase n=1 Tax=Synechococcus sp. PROS-7-1 TaxID=1442556 RepID=UPI00164669DE|nr:TIGR04283 family arsenosugar biosynthesis glycosyltransferase [Synechococcus sp. PROS-7-1]QNI84626.1 beta-glycosyltransferase/ family 2 [Synechococcus sp. PROS-7-1]
MTQAIPSLSVVIPCLNESERLPLLLADLQQGTSNHELVIADGGSIDGSLAIARLSGAHVIAVEPAGRGHQLAAGARQASGTWLLFLHADSRLPKSWAERIRSVLLSPQAAASAWYFDLQIQPGTPMRHLLAKAVALRSRWLQRPYGDQGLLLHQTLYARSGGFADVPLMEDLDLVERLSKIASLRPLHTPLITDGRRWDRCGVLRRSLQNFKLKRRWKQGVSLETLARDYYAS